jgi:hypothetical protein
MSSPLPSSLFLISSSLAKSIPVPIDFSKKPPKSSPNVSFRSINLLASSTTSSTTSFVTPPVAANFKTSSTAFVALAASVIVKPPVTASINT